jgi:hypothetical protein
MYQPNVPPTLDDMIAGEFDFAPSIRVLAGAVQQLAGQVKDLGDQVEALQNARPPQPAAPTAIHEEKAAIVTNPSRKPARN